MSQKLLQSLLDDTIALSLKTLHFHWVVTGPHFSALHDLFNTQYKALSESADHIAERMRSLSLIPTPFTSLDATFSIDPTPKKTPKYTQILEILALDHEKLALFSSEASQETTTDPATSNLFAEKQEYHSKAAWFLRSHLQ